jgi:hypothetical protein
MDNETPEVNERFRTDEEFQNLLPPLTAEDFDQLEKSILEDGCRDALIIWSEEKILVDGYNRFAICKKHNRPYEVESKSFSDRDEVMDWMIENQKSRRNMNKFLWAETVLKRRNRIASEAKKNQRAGGGAVRLKSNKPVDTLDTLAKLAGITRDALYKVSVILTTATANPNNVKLQWQIEQLRKGDPDVSISGVYKELRQPTSKRATKSAITAEDSVFDMMRDQWGDREVLEQEGIIPKANVEMSPGLEDQINAILAALEELEGQYPKMTDQVDIYNTVGEWVDDKKRELAKQSLK